MEIIIKNNDILTAMLITTDNRYVLTLRSVENNITNLLEHFLAIIINVLVEIDAVVALVTATVYESFGLFVVLEDRRNLNTWQKNNLKMVF
jgi:hypothetical protein